MLYNNVLEALGHTPMIQLNHMTDENDARILVKFEGVNIGGSIKTRTAVEMLEAAEREGLLNHDSVIVEATSGNQGIGLALAGAVKGYKVVIIMPDSVSEERRKIVKQYGADLVLVHDDNDIGKAIRECTELAVKMAEEDEKVFLPDQFSNYNNVLAHYNRTAVEILEDVEGSIDAYCSGIGTGGTLTGIAKRLKEKNPHLLTVAAEPDQAAILSGGLIGTHVQMGIGDGVIPPILDRDIIDEIMIVQDEDAIRTAQDLARKEGLLVGISSGTNVWTAIQLAKKLGKGKTVVTVLPDTGERYFSTVLFEE